MNPKRLFAALMELFPDHTDIKTLSEAVARFRESRAGFLILFDRSPVCMSMTTTVLDKRTYVRVNHAFLEKFSYTEDEIIGRTSIEIGILDQEESFRVRTLIAKNGALRNDYVKCRAKNGNIVHTVSSIEFMEINGEHVLVSFFIDISKIVEQQALIERNLAQLEAINKELEAFSYSVSHDLRAPLRAINGYAKILEEDFLENLGDSGKKLLLSVQQNALKMATLIDNLLEFAKLGKQSVRKSSIDMALLVKEVIDDLGGFRPPKTKIIVGDLHPANGDYALIKQVVVNLISNAIKYSSKKDAPIVEITSAIENGHVAYAVRDNGAGFSMDYAHKLFGVFQRLHKTEEFEGTGIGLASVQRIILKHGGTVHAEATDGEGAVFSFRLPNVEKTPLTNF